MQTSLSYHDIDQRAFEVSILFLDYILKEFLKQFFKFSRACYLQIM